jgi:hypothetical protein
MAKKGNVQITTTGAWAEQIIMKAEEQLSGVPLGQRAECFQALAYMCFQRTTELAVDKVIDAVDKSLVEAGLSEVSQIVHGVRMSNRKANH